MRRLAAILVLLLASGVARAAPDFGSAHVAVVDETTGEVLLLKDGDTAVPIASLTKLMTAMVVLDAQQDPDERIRIEAADMDRLKHTSAGVPRGAQITRRGLIELALIASDNHAAAALARRYPGGLPAFRAALQHKIVSLGLQHTVIEEPTGLSPGNRSTALDMTHVVRAAARYPVICEITSQREHTVLVNGRRWAVHNTNHLVGAPGWNILTSKTGFTNEAGRCLSMRIEAAGRTVAVVLLGAVKESVRRLDAARIQHWLAQQPVRPAAPAVAAVPAEAPPLASLSTATVAEPAVTAEPAAATH